MQRTKIKVYKCVFQLVFTQQKAEQSPQCMQLKMKEHKNEKHVGKLIRQSPMTKSAEEKFSAYNEFQSLAMQGKKLAKIDILIIAGNDNRKIMQLIRSHRRKCNQFWHIR